MPSRLEQKILFFLVIILGGLFAVLLFWLENQQERAVVDQLKQEARGIYHYIVATRQLISRWKGVYIKDEDGNYIRKTPSGFVAELSKTTGGGTLFQIKLAFQKSTDPPHQPDQFEKAAIEGMQERRAREYWKVVEKELDGHKAYRFVYAAPLIFQSECTGCHSWKPDTEVVGCITIELSATKFFENLKKDQFYYALYMIFAMICVLFLLWGMLRRFVLTPLKQMQQAASRVESGDLSIKVNLNQSTEWQTVGENFNRMVEVLRRQQNRLQEEADTALARMKRAYEELKRVEQYKSDFFTNITHDLKTPITAIKGATNLLERKCTGEMASYIDIVQRNIEKLSAMVQDLLDCSRLESGELKLDLSDNDLSEIVEDAILMAMPLAWKKRIELDYKVPDEPCIARIDPKRLEQVVMNLLSNAIKFSPEDAKVEVRLYREDRYWVVTVTDSGPGVPPDQADLIFQKFYHKDMDGKSSGMGLGLAIAKGIVEAHGGHIGISQPDKEHGTRFFFWIPVSRQNRSEGGNDQG